MGVVESMEKEEKPKESVPEEKTASPNDEGESLENGAILEDNAALPTTKDGAIDATHGSVSASQPSAPPKKSFLQKVSGILNIYLLLFILTILLIGLIAFVSYQKNKQASQKQAQIKTQPLSQEALDQLKQSDVKVGDPKQILSIESNAVFAGRVLVRDGLEVAGPLKIGSPLTLPGLTVSGNSNFEKIQTNELQVSSSTTIQGQLTVQNNLSVGGSATFGGTLTASRLNIQTLLLNGDLQLNRHIDAGGGNPSKTDGSALGGGGTSSVSGTDTAGTVNINVGGGPSAGCFITVFFTQKFNGVPHVVITPVGSWAGGLTYYINRSGTSFSICSTTPATAGQSFSFDYIVID